MPDDGRGRSSTQSGRVFVLIAAHSTVRQQIGGASISDLMQLSGVAFGTSGARGLVSAMTDEVCFAYTAAFLRYLASQGDFVEGSAVALGGDLRPSTPRIMRACAAAVRHVGGIPLLCGHVPTPALALHAFARRIPSLMVTGSHIPDDRNGIKFNRPAGEVLKSDEAGIRAQTVEQPDAATRSLLDVNTPVIDPILQADVFAVYERRYIDVWGATALRGMRIGVYQHSAVGRDSLTRLMHGLGADVVELGRSEQFIPVDTEAIRAEDVELAQRWALQYHLDAIVSTDGDSDRPLLADEQGNWLRGDVLGVLCARALGAQYVVTPVSSNTALEKAGWFAATSRTKIGSPYVIDAMNAALSAGRTRVCGFEANGGFLLADDFDVAGKPLTALPTRDAVLPIVATLVLARAKGLAVSGLLGELPARYTASDRIQNIPTQVSQARLASLQESPAEQCRLTVESAFGPICGAVSHIDWTDGLRITHAGDEIIHLRPSGNAPEMRCYTEAASVERATTINAQALAVVGGWLGA